jgi:hypothetical protein
MAGAEGKNAANGLAIAQQIHHPFPIHPGKGSPQPPHVHPPLGANPLDDAPNLILVGGDGNCPGVLFTRDVNNNVVSLILPMVHPQRLQAIAQIIIDLLLSATGGMAHYQGSDGVE